MKIGRETDLRRTTETIEQRPTMLIVTNGRATEVEYLKALRQERWARQRKVAVVFVGGSPFGLVQDAAKRAARDDYDEAWAVCDVDHFDTARAVEEADGSGVELVWSSPCFEVWLILHKEDCNTFMANAEKCRDRLVKILGSWDKTRVDFAVFRDGVEDAVRRAKALGEPPSANPSTGMWRIVEALRGKPDDAVAKRDASG